jgi:ribonuclease HII
MVSQLLCGLDEVGRGSLAGPIVAAGLVIPKGLDPRAIDSKRLSARKRTIWRADFALLADQLGIRYAYAQVEAGEINLKGITWANCEIFARLIDQLEADLYIVDGTRLKVREHVQDPVKRERVQYLKNADEIEPVVSAASILAKTYRDALMLDLHAAYPQYGWDSNKGYGTPQHIRAIKTWGQTPHHRQQFSNTAKNKPTSPPPLLLLTSGLLPALLLAGQFIQYGL